MSNEACPLPVPPSASEEATIQRLLRAKSIAVVGLTDDPSRPSHDVSSYLQDHGYEITPVNPGLATALGKRAYKSLAELPAPPDVVLVFRRPEHCAQVAKDAVAAGAKGLWLQAGIQNDEAKRIAAEAGIPFVQDRCMKVEHIHHSRKSV